MKYLKRFESLQPIDVDLDIEEFWEKFGNIIRSRDEKTEERFKREPYIKKRIDKLTQDFGYTMTDDYKYYEICEVDDYGRCTNTLMTLRAVNKDHAKLKCANKYDGKKSKAGALEIFTTGFYSAEEVDIKKEISDTELKISALQKKLEELKRIS